VNQKSQGDFYQSQHTQHLNEVALFCQHTYSILFWHRSLSGRGPTHPEFYNPFLNVALLYAALVISNHFKQTNLKINFGQNYFSFGPFDYFNYLGNSHLDLICTY
jgi:hypothetical protein